MESYKITDKEIKQAITAARKDIRRTNGGQSCKVTGWALRVQPEYIQLQITYVNYTGVVSTFNVAL